MIEIKGQPTKQNGGAAWTSLGHLNIAAPSERFIRQQLTITCAMICQEQTDKRGERFRVVATMCDGDDERIIVDMDSLGAVRILI